MEEKVLLAAVSSFKWALKKELFRQGGGTLLRLLQVQGGMDGGHPCTQLCGDTSFKETAFCSSA